MVAAMSAVEREEHEEKKLKMRKAMGENLGDDVEGEEPSAKERRLNLIRCSPAEYFKKPTRFCALIHSSWLCAPVLWNPAIGQIQDSRWRQPKKECLICYGGAWNDEQHVEILELEPIKPGRAVEGDDWSSVIDGQSAETVAPELVEAQLRAARNPIATPFSRASVHRSIGAPLLSATNRRYQSRGGMLRLELQGASCTAWSPCRSLHCWLVL